MSMEKNEHGFIKTEYDNKKAFIIGKDHPHFNSTAICLGVDTFGNKPGMVFKNDNGTGNFAVFNGKEVKWLK